jgi:hypothetical protein
MNTSATNLENASATGVVYFPGDGAINPRVSFTPRYQANFYFQTVAAGLKEWPGNLNNPIVIK